MKSALWNPIPRLLSPPEPPPPARPRRSDRPHALRLENSFLRNGVLVAFFGAAEAFPPALAAGLLAAFAFEGPGSCQYC